MESEVKALVHCKGANSDIFLPKYGISAFHLAVGIEPVSFSKEVTTTFLISGGNPNIRSSDGLTPVHVAAIWGRTENLELLLISGGDPRALDDEGYSPLHYAKEKGHMACVDIIQKFMWGHGTCSPTLGLFSILGSGIESRNGDNLNDPILKKGINNQDKILDVLGCKFSLSGFVSECENFNGCFSGQETKQRVTQGIFEDIGLISEDNSNNDSVHIIGTENPSQVDVKNKRTSRALDETYLINGSLDIRYLNYCHIADDCITQDDSESVSDASSKDLFAGESVRNATYAVSVHESPYPHLNKNGSVGWDWSPVGVTHDCSFETTSPITNPSYANFMYSVESRRSSTPLQRRIGKPQICHLEDTCGVSRRKPLDLSRERSSILSISCPELYKECLEEETKNITNRRKAPSKDSRDFEISRSENEEYFTVPEEVYEITDEEEGIVLEEKRLETPVFSGKVVHQRTDEDFPREGQIFRASSVDSLTSACTEDIRKELYKVVSCGCRCPLGPITATTKRVYLRIIKKFKTVNANLIDSEPLLPLPSSDSKFSRELEITLSNPTKFSHGKYFDLEQKMMMQFDGKGQWRDGNQKSSFNYLLLDPRLTLNLPLRWANDGSFDKSFYSNASSQYWREFLRSIFYVGKGKRTRPFSHLYEAVTAWRSNSSDVLKVKKKVKHIIEIWKENLGVVCVHLFQNVIPAEALTREAAMIDALGLKNLTNEQRGKYYGLISTLGFSEKRYFGSFLLHRALILFLAEGERQIKPADLY